MPNMKQFSRNQGLGWLTLLVVGAAVAIALLA